MEWPALNIVYEKTKVIDLNVPYVPGYLAFREAMPLLTLLREIPKQWHPQVILYPRTFAGARMFELFVHAEAIRSFFHEG
jgi:hypothetical protein